MSGQTTLEKIGHVFIPSIVSGGIATGIEGYLIGFERLKEVINLGGKVPVPTGALIFGAQTLAFILGEVIFDVIPDSISKSLENSMTRKLLDKVGPATLGGTANFALNRYLIDKDLSFVNTFGVSFVSNISTKYIFETFNL